MQVGKCVRFGKAFLFFSLHVQMTQSIQRARHELDSLDEKTSRFLQEKKLGKALTQTYSRSKSFFLRCCVCETVGLFSQLILHKTGSSKVV